MVGSEARTPSLVLFAFLRLKGVFQRAREKRSVLGGIYGVLEYRSHLWGKFWS